MSRVGNEELRRLIRQTVNRLYTLQEKANDLYFEAMMHRPIAEAWRWDEPVLGAIILLAIASLAPRKTPDHS